MAKSFEWNYKNAGELMLRSAEIAEICDAEARRMTVATGMRYKSNVRRGKKRVQAKAIGGRFDPNVKRSRRYKKKG